LSGFGKRGIGAYSETRKQFHEFGAQSIAARRGERVKRKKRQFDVLGQHVILRRNIPSVPPIFRPARDTSLRFLLLNQKAVGAADAVLVSISRQKAEFVSRLLGLPIGQVADVSDLQPIEKGYPDDQTGR
jgi:hypothetical protein